MPRQFVGNKTTHPRLFRLLDKAEFSQHNWGMGAHAEMRRRRFRILPSWFNVRNMFIRSSKDNEFARSASIRFSLLWDLVTIHNDQVICFNYF